jgi:lysophospholipase
MRLLLSLLCVLSLVACGPQDGRTPFVASRIPPGLPMRAYPPEGWAWGLIRLGADPPLRYGVAAPQTAPRGQILIMPDYGEPAEAWFEAANGLIAQGFSVWVLEAAGQGDVDALNAMRAVMGRRPTVFIAQGAAAPVLMEALRAGLPAQAAVLSAPILTPVLSGPDVYDVEAAAPLLTEAGLGWLRAFGQPAWKAQVPLPAGRAGVIGAWQAANPELRIGGASWGWISALQDQTDALKAGSLLNITAPVLILHPQTGPSADEIALCRRLSHCTLTAIGGAKGSLHLESDQALASWIAAASDLVRQTSAQDR